jgi:hypothetical protein
MESKPINSTSQTSLPVTVTPSLRLLLVSLTEETFEKFIVIFEAKLSI